MFLNPIRPTEIPPCYNQFMENISSSPKSTSSSNNFVSFLILIIVILVIALVGISGYLMGQKNNQQKEKFPSEASQLSSTPTQGPLITSSTPTPTIDEESILKQAIKSALIAEHGSQASSLSVTVSKINGNYASGGAAEQNGGGMWFATKVNGIWKLVWDGNGTISCSNFTLYPNYPTNMVPECWDEANQKLIKR
jgi:hypothetical protein